MVILRRLVYLEFLTTVSIIKRLSVFVKLRSQLAEDVFVSFQILSRFHSGFSIHELWEGLNFKAGLSRNYGGVQSQLQRSSSVLKGCSFGIGTYGAVFKAKCDNLICAAKILHTTLFNLDQLNAY